MRMFISSTRPRPVKGFTNPATLPKFLIENGKFCVWRYETRKDKPDDWTKKPYCPNDTQKGADSTNPADFTDLQTAIDAGNSFDGLGLGVFGDVCAIDIDHCIDDDGNLSILARTIIDLMDSYTEISPSGKGIRIIFRAPGISYDKTKFYINRRSATDPREKWPQAQGLEIYIAGMTNKYVTITGDAIHGIDVYERGVQIMQIVERYMKRKQTTKTAAPEPARKSLDLSDRKLLDKARNAANGDRFKALFDAGDWKSQGFHSQSEADLSLCVMLAYWTGRDFERIDALFRQSKLMRSKWDRNDYATNTIDKAIASCPNVYDPQSMFFHPAPEEAPPHPAKTFHVEKKQSEPTPPTIFHLGDQEQINTPETPASAATVPEEHSNQSLIKTPTTYEPQEHTDVFQGKLFAEVYGNVVCYSPQTGFMVYDGAVWQESDLQAQGFAQDLTVRQLQEARKRVTDAQREYNSAVESGDKAKIKAAKADLSTAENFRAFVLRQQKADRIRACMFACKPEVEVDFNKLDADPYLLNTPEGHIDIQTGEIMPHDPTAYCTKITTVSPNGKNAEMFDDFMMQLCCGDSDLVRYLQEICGTCAMGIPQSGLVICYGNGGNGKSTFWNLIFKVLGSYSGMLSSDVFTRTQMNRKNEAADLRGLRMVLTKELKEGAVLDTGTLKDYCSGDDAIKGERKYKDGFEFYPTHTTILYTNPIPNVHATDNGTWDRLFMVPFNARFRHTNGEILHYEDHLFNECGGAVLAWIIRGAQRVIENGGKITLAQCVKDANAEFRGDNDWLQMFLAQCCETGGKCKEQSSCLYARYQQFCEETGMEAYSNKVFKAAMTAAGFKYSARRGSIYAIGVQVKAPDLAPVEVIPTTGSNGHRERSST